MSSAIKVYTKRPMDVEALQHDGSVARMDEIIDWIEKHAGTAFYAAELEWRPGYGTYWHPRHHFIYLPQGGKRVGGELVPLEDDELVILTRGGTFALVFPGDYVVRSRYGFYPLNAESFLRGHALDESRRGTGHLTLPSSS
ncbi:hypothetical protein SEA_RIZWANA_7 [Arthrobacter phage Rizwana]|nr:hypothetical protein SEA_RIZWANA_7 [Arthrobacter phage Rizwana]